MLLFCIISVAFMKRFISEESFERLFVYTHLQFIKGKGCLVCDVRVATHTQNCPKKWSAESEANGLSCESARENLSAHFNKTVH